MNKTRFRWQCVFVCWGDRYGVEYINALVAEIRAHASSIPRFCLITEAAKSGLDSDVRICPFPNFFLRPEYLLSGCQAKLAMFEAGVLPDDLPAVYVDLDTIVLGDLERGIEFMSRRDTVLMLQSAIVPFGILGRLIACLTNGRRYARGNSSILVFHPAECAHIASCFRELSAKYPLNEFRPTIADERFISWAAQPQMKALPRNFAVKFTSEYMSVWAPWLFLKVVLRSSQRRRQAAVTLNGPAIKPWILMELSDGARVVDNKGRVLIWSDRTLGHMKAKIISFFDNFHFFPVGDKSKARANCKVPAMHLEQPHIVYGADRPYLGPLLVSMYSLLKTLSGKAKITIVTAEPYIAVDAPEIHALKDHFPGHDITVQHFDDPGLREYERVRATRFSGASMIPLFIPWIIPDDRCLFLDADTVVMQDIAELWNTDLQGMLVGACKDVGLIKEAGKYLRFSHRDVLQPSRVRRRKSNFLSRLQALDLEGPTDRYFNSGVVLYDTRGIREFDRSRSLKDIGLSLKHVGELPDQDKLNVFFRNRVRFLDLKWNVYAACYGHLYTPGHADLRAEMKAAVSNPGILHYTHLARKPAWKRRLTFGVRKNRYRTYRETCLALRDRTGIDVIPLLDQLRH